MGRQKLEIKRVCVKCGSTDTYFDEYYHWYRKRVGFYCDKCHNKERNDRRVNFRGKQFILKSNPRIGVCNWCRAIVPFDTSRTVMHHEEYNIKEPGEHIIELCPKCHYKTFRFFKPRGRPWHKN